MAGWTLLAGLPGDAAQERWCLRLEDDDTAAFARFAAGCFERAGSPELRAAYDVLEGPWARDWGFLGFVGWLLLRGEAVYERVLADPEQLTEVGFPGDAQDFVMALLEIGMPLPTPVAPSPEAAFPRIAAWREARFQPFGLAPDPGHEVRKRLLDAGRCDAGGWGRFRARRRQGGVTVTFQAGPPFRGGERPDDHWTPWLAPMLDGAAQHREFVAHHLGAFRFELQPARVGRNPVTGQAFEIPGLLVPRFRAAPDLLALLAPG